MTYNKLVRDKIPDMIISSGEYPITCMLNDAEYKEELLGKLVEEVVSSFDASVSC